MSSHSYTSCIKIGGVPIIPPLVTPQIREQCLGFKMKAIEREKKKERNRLFKKCMNELEQLEHQTKDLSLHTTLENQLVFNEESPRDVPYNKYKKMQNLISETIDVSEYSEDGVKVINISTDSEDHQVIREDSKVSIIDSIDSDTVHKIISPKLIRSNSYTLESPSPILLAHLEKEARKCIELNKSESESSSPITIIDSEVEPFLQAIDTDISVQEIKISTPFKPQGAKSNLDPQLLDILDKLPEEHARNILHILSKQEETNRTIKEMINEEQSMSVSISSQSLYYSTLSPDTTRESPHQLNFVKLHNLKNTSMSRDKAASLIQACVRGYLVRRLIRTEKVQSLISTIKDAILCAVQLHDAEIIEEADVELHRRLIQQVSAACYAFHDIFFTLSVKEQLGIISFDRQRKVEKANRPLSSSSSNLSLSRRHSARIIK